MYFCIIFLFISEMSSVCTPRKAMHDKISKALTCTSDDRTIKLVETKRRTSLGQNQFIENHRQ